MIIKSVDSISLGKVTGCLTALMGLLSGGVFALVAMAGVGLGANENVNGQAAAIVAGMGMGMIIVFPLIFGVAGFIMGIIYALLYNIAASLVGGIEIVTDQRYSDD